MGFNADDSMVRVDFWKVRDDGMKWGYTEAVEWMTYRAYADRDGNRQEGGKLIHDAFEEALDKHLTKPDGTKRMRGLMATCLEPYHEQAHPIAVMVR